MRCCGSEKFPAPPCVRFETRQSLTATRLARGEGSSGLISMRMGISMKLSLRFVGKVDARLKREILQLFKWLRRWYTFPNALEIRLVHQQRLIAFDGTTCALEWWQSSRGQESVTGKIAVGTFAKNFREGGPGVAYSTVIAAVGRVLKYYYQAIRDSPQREDYADLWGDKILDAYFGGAYPPPPWPGAWKQRSSRIKSSHVTRTPR